MKLNRLCCYASALLLSLAAPVIARAEPAASMAHLPFLWMLATGVCAVFAWIVVRVAGRAGRLRTPLRKWALGIILLVVLLVFVAPIIVGTGSILITGRTM